MLAWLREVEVRFQNLNVTAPISVGSSGLPTILNSYKSAFQVLPALTVIATGVK